MPCSQSYHDSCFISDLAEKETNIYQVFTSSSVSSECYSDFFCAKLGPQENLSKAVDVVSGCAKFHTQNRLTVKIANNYVGLSLLPGFSKYELILSS